MRPLPPCKRISLGHSVFEYQFGCCQWWCRCPILPSRLLIERFKVASRSCSSCVDWHSIKLLVPP
jgi:hypothetical protein